MRHLCPWCDYNGADRPSGTVLRDLTRACLELKWIEENIERFRVREARTLDPHEEASMRQQAEAAERLADITRDNMRRWLGQPTESEPDVHDVTDLLYGNATT